MERMAPPDPSSEAFLFRALMESTADSIYFKDRQCRLIRVSRKMAVDLGFSDPAELIGKTDIELFGETFGEGTRLDDLRVMETGRPIIGLVESRQLEGGHVNWTLSSKLPLRSESGEIIGLVGITREINEMRQAEVALQHLATHDPLTDLPNRFLMLDRLAQLLSRAQRYGSAFAVLFMDIDRFKDVNDSYGHECGDRLLRGVAERLTGAVRKSDTVARIGGDEFVIILEATHGAQAAGIVAGHVQRALRRPLALDDHDAKVTLSIGISLFPEHGGDIDTLLRVADTAMYRAKKEGGDRHVTGTSSRPPGGDRLGGD